jgi:Tfp pilus assembly protein PilF
MLKCSLFLFLVFLLLLSLTTGAPAARSEGFSADALRPDRSRMGDTGQISGIVNVASTNAAASDVEVTIQSTMSGFTRKVFTDDSGHFEAEALPSGSYTVCVRENGYGIASTTAFVDGGRTAVTLELRPLNPGVGLSPGITVTMHELCVPAKAQSLFQDGLVHLRKQDYAASIRSFSKAIAKYPDFYEAYYHLGLAQVNLGRKDQAANSFQSAINLSGGKYSWADFAYGLLLCQQGKVKDAEIAVRQGLLENQNSPDGHIAMAVVDLHLDRLDEAEKNARDALSLSARAHNAYLVLADIHNLQRNYSAEVQDLNSFLSLQLNGPRSQYARDLLSAAQRMASETAARNKK